MPGKDISSRPREGIIFFFISPVLNPPDRKARKAAEDEADSYNGDTSDDKNHTIFAIRTGRVGSRSCREEGHGTIDRPGKDKDDDTKHAKEEWNEAAEYHARQAEKVGHHQKDDDGNHEPLDDEPFPHLLVAVPVQQTDHNGHHHHCKLDQPDHQTEH